MRSINITKSAVLPALAAALCFTAGITSVTPARAASYGRQQQTINAGILLLDTPSGNPSNLQLDLTGAGTATDAGSFNPSPYLFYILNARTDIKPYGWNIVNPQAPHNVTQPILTRWNARTTYDGSGSAGAAYAASLGGSVYTLGQEITSSMAPYWEVPISQQTISSIQQYDVLFLRLKQGIRIRRQDAELLTHFVESGGTLWVEGIGNSGFKDPDALFFALTIAQGSSASQAFVPVTAGPTGAVPFRAPIISSPYLLTQNELSQLGFQGIRDTIADSTQLLSGTVLVGSPTGPPAIAAAQFGAGTVVVTTTGTSDEINGAVGGLAVAGFNSPNAGPYSGEADTTGLAPDLQGALGNGPTADLKLAYNIMAWAGEHAQEHKNAHQNADSPGSLSSAVVPLWSYPVTPLAQPSHAEGLPAPAIFGNIAVARGADGLLHAFDTNPAERLFGNNNADDGVKDYSLGTSYDELWSTSLGSNAQFASAPTIYTRPAIIGTTTPEAPVVAVQLGDGSVATFNLLTGAPDVVGVLPNSASTGANYAGLGVVAPAPTFFDGKIFCGQYNGTVPKLYVYDYQTTATGNKGGTLALSPSTPGGTEYPTAPPSVGSIAEGIPGDLGNTTNDFVVTVPTNYGVSSLFIGTRNEKLSGSASPFSTRLMGNNDTVIDGGAVPPPTGYTINSATGYKDTILSVFGSPPQQFASPSLTPGTPYTAYGSYDLDFQAGYSAVTPAFSRVYAGVASQSFETATAMQSFVSAPARDKNGYVFYNAGFDSRVVGNLYNSSITCMSDSSNPGQRRLRWRFRLPYNTPFEDSLDADGNDYSALAGYRFVGTPVVDNNDNVYAVATNGTSFAVLCFDGAASPSADLAAAVPGQLSITQPWPISNTTPNGNEFSQADVLFPLSPGQFTTNGAHVTFTSFGLLSGGNPPQLYPNLAEPEPFLAAVQQNGPAAQANQGALVRFHTNLRWFTIASSPTGAITNVSGPTKIGKYLYIGGTVAGTGSIYRVYAYAHSDNMVGINRFVAPGTANSDSVSEVSAFGNLGLASIDSAPAVANGRMVVNSVSGIAAVGGQDTLVADNNRLIDMDSNGNAVFTIDSTTKTTVSGTYPKIHTAATKVDLNRPSSLSQIAANDYLIVDTGNNRCVQVDRAGHVLWEVNRFYADPANPGLLAPGESYRLNQPTGAQVVRTYDATTNILTIHYLISDSGNYRVVEVTDRYDAAGKLLAPAHVLTWVSHTFDRLGRKYRYQNANYFVDSAGTPYVAALISNARVGRLTTSAAPLPGQMASATSDGQGSTIALLDYNSASPNNGFIGFNGSGPGSSLNVVSSFTAYLSGGSTATPFNAPFDQTHANGKTLLLRNPRYLGTYTSQGPSNTPRQSFLIADDNGVYDMFFTSTGFQAVWGYTPYEYYHMTTPIDSAGVAANVGADRYRGGQSIPFLASCVQRTGAGRYLITNSASVGDSTSVLGRAFTGEVFEVQANGTASPEVHVVPGGFSGHTFAYPDNAGPLTQPLFALRPL